jgi:ElaB/YqjD/DUF883 family membrane-anchored ribosome-binding protein
MTQQRSDYPKHSGESTQDRVREMADKAGEKLKDAGASAQAMAENVTEQARQYGEKAQEAAREFKPFVEKSMKEKPMQTLAGAAVIGFLLGALWKK